MTTVKASPEAKAQLQDDDDIQLGEDSESTSNGSDSMGEDGPTKESKGTILSNDEAEREEDDRIIAAAKNDPRFNQCTDRRLLRFSVIFKLGKAAMGMSSFEKMFDFSDEAVDKVSVGSKWVQCKKGNHVCEEAEGGTDGMDNFRPLSEEEKAEQDDGTDCTCEICISRSKFQAYVDASVDEDRKLRASVDEDRKMRAAAAVQSSQKDASPQVIKECK